MLTVKLLMQQPLPDKKKVGGEVLDVPPFLHTMQIYGHQTYQLQKKKKKLSLHNGKEFCTCPTCVRFYTVKQNFQLKSLSKEGAIFPS